MVVYTGRVGKLTVSGVDQTTTGLPMEATIVIGKERGKYNAIGTDVSEITTGMKVVSGTIRKRWASGDTCLQDLLNGTTEFTVKVEINVASSGASVTASGCLIETVTRRMAPGTDVMMEEAPFVGRDWY